MSVRGGLSAGWGGSGVGYTGARDENVGINSNSAILAKIQEKANVETKARETEVRGIMDQIINMYRKGGDFGRGLEAGLERERTKTMSAGGQALISSGLFNTTQMAGLSGKFEEEVAAPTRMKLEDLRMEKLQGALGQKAQFVTDIQNTAPDYRLLAQLLSQGT